MEHELELETFEHLGDDLAFREEMRGPRPGQATGPKIAVSVLLHEFAAVGGDPSVFRRESKGQEAPTGFQASPDLGHDLEYRGLPVAVERFPVEDEIELAVWMGQVDEI